jgi:thioredoxin 1
MHMAKPLEVTDATFEDEIIKSDKLTVVDFWAVWCGPCRMIGPVIEELAGEYDEDVKFTKVNVDENQKFAGQFGIRSIPSILFFKDGKVVDNVIGAVPKGTLDDKIKEHK